MTPARIDTTVRAAGLLDGTARYSTTALLPRTILYASLTTLAIGLFFVFVWAPHPWSWRGIDQYDELARALARGEPFGTTDVPWGYAYFVAAFYALFPGQAWATVTAQVALNALVPLLLYRLAEPAVGRRVATLAAWITAVFSFNTVYASTQTSDSICTVLFLGALLCFVRGHTHSSTAAFAAAGVLSGLVPQFRPNMILLPVLVIAAYVIRYRGGRRWLHGAVFLAAMALMLLPWTVRNYRYTGTFQPTSTHSGIQLWYGTLQVGPYLESRAHNPRSAFASPAFDYTSLPAPMVVSAETPCRADGATLRLVYRTDRDPAPQSLTGGVDATAGRRRFEIPAQPLSTTVYVHFEDGDATFPQGGSQEPFIYFVSNDHLGDLDGRHELLDVFDIGRLMRHFAWQEPLPEAAALDLTRDGQVDTADLAAAVAALLPQADAPFARFEPGQDRAVVHFADGSTLAMPRQFNGRQTGVEVDGNLAGVLVSRHRSFAALAADATRPRNACPPAAEVRINEVFYRKEPHEMRRYTALALDNIARDPVAFAQASAYRMVRLFIIRPGTDDQHTTFQYRGSEMIFNAGLILSLAYFAMFVAGVVIAVRRRSPFLYALIPIAYVPLTICFVLTNMRYTLTVQPLMFVFVAVTVAAVLRLERKTT
jgi:hypothetical protein